MKRATWRHSSLPMLPPAPVMSTVLPCSVCAMPASSSCTGSRPSRSSGSMSRRRSTWRLARAQFVGAGHGQHRQAGARGQVQRTARCARLAAGMAITTCVAVPQTPCRQWLSGPSTGTPAMRAPCLVRSSSSRPSTTQPCWCRPASSSAPPHPRPGRWRGALRRAGRQCASARVHRSCGRPCAPRTRPSAPPPGAGPARRAAPWPGPGP
jgi:hypothetical protein